MNRTDQSPVLDKGTLDLDLFGDRPRFRKSPRPVPQQSPELARARALCRELSRTRALTDKQRVAHLICLNLKAMLSRPAAH